MYTGVADKLEDQKEMDDYQRGFSRSCRHSMSGSRCRRVGLPIGPGRRRLRLASPCPGTSGSRLDQLAAAECAEAEAGTRTDSYPNTLPSLAYRGALAQSHHEIGIVLQDAETPGRVRSGVQGGRVAMGRACVESIPTSPRIGRSWPMFMLLLVESIQINSAPKKPR